MLIWCDVIVNACVTVANSWPQSLISVAKMTVINSPGQRNYMGEVSRLLIASPGLRLLETFYFIVFSSLVGLMHPISVLFFFFKCYHLIFLYYSSDGCHSVV